MQRVGTRSWVPKSAHHWGEPGGLPSLGRGKLWLHSRQEQFLFPKGAVQEGSRISFVVA